MAALAAFAASFASFASAFSAASFSFSAAFSSLAIAACSLMAMRSAFEMFFFGPAGAVCPPACPGE